jgi:hypothetical protein
MIALLLEIVYENAGLTDYVFQYKKWAVAFATAHENK